MASVAETPRCCIARYCQRRSSRPKAFLLEGYDAATLDRIAAAAKVSKQTVYSHFTDKETLFAAVVEAARRQRDDPAAAPPANLDPADLQGSLTATGEALLAAAHKPEVAALRRIMIAELGRRPTLRDQWNSGAPNTAVTHLATELATLNAMGVVHIPSIPLAVEQFLALLGHPANNRSLYGVQPLTPSDRRDIAASAADLFVRAYGPRPANASEQ